MFQRHESRLLNLQGLVNVRPGFVISNPDAFVFPQSGSALPIVGVRNLATNGSLLMQKNPCEPASLFCTRFLDSASLRSE
jgi:hypothetical protein